MSAVVRSPEPRATMPALCYRFGFARRVARCLLAGVLICSAVGSASAQRPAVGGASTVIGVEEGSRPYVFGAIAGVAPTRDGGVLVLDMMQQELRWFDASGRHRASVGRKGRGPGEFLQPSALAVTADGLVHVVDNPNQRISTFAPSPDGRAMVHLRDIRLRFPASDICAVGQHLYVLALGRERLIHELDARGGIVRSFGEAERPDASLARRVAGAGGRILHDLYNQGVLSCDSAAGRIVLVHSARFIVRAFTADGRSLWRVTLAGADPQELSAIRGGTGIRVGPNRDTGMRSSADAVAFDGNGLVIVTIARMQVGSSNSHIVYQQRTLRISDGRETGRTVSRGLVRAVVHGRRYATSSEPFPHVLIF